MRIVVDTNVLVAGLLSPYGPPAQVLQLLLSERCRLCYDTRILEEYRQVLCRPKFGFDPILIEVVVEFLEQTGELVPAPPLGVTLPDPDDAMFIEVAVAGQADCLVTGDLRHYPKSQCGDVRVLSPAEFVQLNRGG